MTFPELVQEVLKIVKRPDLQERIEGAVRSATLRIHHSDFFYKDLVEVPVQFTEAKTLQNFLPTDVIPNFRKSKYVRQWQGDVDGMPGVFLEHIQIENSVDGYGCNKENVFYLAGQLIQTRTCFPLYRALFGAYVHPIITPSSSYNSWVAVEYPYAIIYDAARAVFNSISYAEQANSYERLAAEIIAEIKLSCVDDTPMT